MTSYTGELGASLVTKPSHCPQSGLIISNGGEMKIPITVLRKIAEVAENIVSLKMLHAWHKCDFWTNSENVWEKSLKVWWVAWKCSFEWLTAIWLDGLLWGNSGSRATLKQSTVIRFLQCDFFSKNSSSAYGQTSSVTVNLLYPTKKDVVSVLRHTPQ